MRSTETLDYTSYLSSVISETAPLGVKTIHLVGYDAAGFVVLQVMDWSASKDDLPTH